MNNAESRKKNADVLAELLVKVAELHPHTPHSRHDLFYTQTSVTRRAF